MLSSTDGTNHFYGTWVGLSILYATLGTATILWLGSTAAVAATTDHYLLSRYYPDHTTYYLVHATHASEQRRLTQLAGRAGR